MGFPRIPVGIVPVPSLGDGKRAVVACGKAGRTAVVVYGASHVGMVVPFLKLPVRMAVKPLGVDRGKEPALLHAGLGEICGSIVIFKLVDGRYDISLVAITFFT